MKTMFIQLIVLFLLLTTECLNAAETKEYLLERTRPVTEEFFGMTIHRANSTTRWPSVPFGSWRLWDSYLKWSDIQPSSTEWRFDDFDRQVQMGQKHGKELIYTLGQTPRWASSEPNEKHAWGLGAGAMPRNMNDWRRYVESVVMRYKGKIAAYEIWNEPKYKEWGSCKGAIFFCGSPEELVRLTEIAYETIKRIDPAAKVVSPCFTDGLRGVERLDKFLKAGGSKYIEVISFHFYELEPEKVGETVRALREVMRKHGLSNLPIWNTEVGYLIQNQEGTVVKEQNVGTFSRVMQEREGAERLLRMMAISAASGIERVFWYAWDDKRMGLIGTKDGKPNSTGIAYGVASRWLVNSTITCSNSLSDSRWTCVIKRNGREATLVWRADSNRSHLNMKIPGVGKMIIEDVQGIAKVVTGGQVIDWDGTPLIIVQDGKPWISK
jgi:hypothetical protein